MKRALEVLLLGAALVVAVLFAKAIFTVVGSFLFSNELSSGQIPNEDLLKLWVLASQVLESFAVGAVLRYRVQAHNWLVPLSGYVFVRLVEFLIVYFVFRVDVVYWWWRDVAGPAATALSWWFVGRIRK